MHSSPCNLTVIFSSVCLHMNWSKTTKLENFYFLAFHNLLNILYTVTFFMFKIVLAVLVSHTRLSKNNSFTVVRKASTLNLKQTSSYQAHLKE